MRKFIVVLAVGSLWLGACNQDSDPAAVDDTVEDTVDVDEFDTLDANGDSYLDVDEVAEWVDDEGVFQEWDSDSDSELDADEIPGNAFQLWDADGDGTITESEWQTGTELFLPADSEVEALSDWDSDGDSELDVDEFSERFDASLLGETWSADTFDESTFQEAFFELYDVDDDGQVTRDEWIEGVELIGTPTE